MNPDLEKLQPYPFEKLAKLKADCNPPAHLAHIALSIGEPKHTPPKFVVDELISHLHGLASYPNTKGSDALRQSISAWLERRFGAKTDPARHILPVAGTREALFSFCQAVVNRQAKPLVLMPNPFYQIYEGAALLAGAEVGFYNTTAETAYLPDFDAISDADWQRCQLIYICSPGNPSGATLDKAALRKLIALSDQYHFVIASDECYSEIYLDENDKPAGLLEVCADMGRDDFKNCVVFHSLSKRSNLPGLRSGFVAGDAEVMAAYFKYRTYHGANLPPSTQAASIKAWDDEAHVVQNRGFYREKFTAVLAILADVLPVSAPPASFYLWVKTPIDDQEFARRLFDQQHVTVLPGRYLSRESQGMIPGANHVRMALVAPLDECIEAAERIKQFVESL